MEAKLKSCNSTRGDSFAAVQADWKSLDTTTNSEKRKLLMTVALVQIAYLTIQIVNLDIILLSQIDSSLLHPALRKMHRQVNQVPVAVLDYYLYFVTTVILLLQCTDSLVVAKNNSSCEHNLLVFEVGITVHAQAVFTVYSLCEKIRIN